MKSNDEWLHALADTGGERFSGYAVVIVEAKATLDALPEGQQLTTTQLVERLFPEATARGDGIAARQRIFRALARAAKATSFRDYVSKGPMKRWMGKASYPTIWHKSDGTIAKDGKGQITCPVCGHAISLD